MDLRNVSFLISTSGHHWERDGSRQKPETFYVVHCMMQSALMAYTNVQCILDCLPVSVSTEPVYSDDQFADSFSNPYKLYINATEALGKYIIGYTAARKWPMLPGNN